MKIPKAIAATLLIFHLGAVEKSNQECWCKTPNSMRVNARHIESNGIGYNQGYTTLEGFFPLYQGWDQWMVFLDTRLHIFNSGRPALNAGFGTRYLADDRVWGLNTYYDYRKTHRFHYNQVAFGFESLGTIWDFRLNGYAPVGATNSRNYNTEFHKFRGHHAIVRQKYEYALAGLNAEAGAHVDTWKRFPLYFAAGPYYLTGKGAAAWGGEARASVLIYDTLKLEAYTSYDHLFRWTGQGQASLGYSFGPKKRVRKTSQETCNLAARAYEPVGRFEIIPVDKKSVYSKGINPLTGDPFTFWFVNNLSHCDGSIESPCNTLVPVDTDVIYVFAGDGTSSGMDNGIVLKDNQRLWGSAAYQPLLTQQGKIVILPMSGGIVGGATALPIISNNSGNVVTLANNNEISGLFLENGDAAYAIIGGNITNATVTHCTLAGPNKQGYDGIFIEELAGTLAISNCVFNQNYGVYLINSTTNATLDITNSNFSGGTGTTASVTWELSNAVQGTLTASNNIFNSYYTGIEVDCSNTSAIDATINNNKIYGGGYGVYINGTSASDATQIVSINRNTFDTYYQPIYFIQNGTLAANITDNIINATYYSLEVDTISGTGHLMVTNNSMTTYDEYAVYFNHTGGDIASTFNNNSITSIDDYCIYSTMTAAANNHTLNMNGNTLVGDYGWELTQSVGTVVSNWINNHVTAYEYGITTTEQEAAVSQTLTLTGNTIQGEYGVYLDQYSGTLNATLNNNIITTTTDEEGLYCQATMAATNTNIVATGNKIASYYGIELDQQVGDLNFTLTGNTITGSNALYLEFSNPTTTMDISGNKFDGYQTIYLEQSAGTLNSTFTNNLVRSGGSDAILYAASGPANATQTISGNTITAGGYASSAINLGLNGTGTTTVTVSNNALRSGAGSAVLSQLNSGTEVLTCSNNTIFNSGGFSLQTTDANATWNVNNNLFTASNSTPVSATAAGTSTVCMQLNNNTAYPTAGAYVLHNAGSGTFILNPPINDIGQLTTTNVTTGICP